MRATLPEFPNHQNPRVVLASARLGVIEDAVFTLAADRTIGVWVHRFPLQHGYLLPRTGAGQPGMFSTVLVSGLNHA
jgi:hypothetical protein